MRSPTIRSETRGDWTKFTLVRPAQLNAFTEAMLQALIEELEQASADTSCRAVLLTGEGRGFCAGQDLADLPAGETDLGDRVDRFYNVAIRAIRSMPKPVICAVNGVAAGAGANIALACDVVLAARSAKFIQAFAKIGLVPDSGGTYALPRLIGDARARALAMLAEPLAAETAAAWGMIWKVVDDADLQVEAEALTQRLAAQPTQGLALIKRAFAASSANSLDQQLDLERDLQRIAGRTPDYAEGIAAFLEKRPAVFTGQARVGKEG